MQFGTLAQFIEDSATRTPEAVALVEGSRRLTYANATQLVRGLGAALVRRGLRRYDRVGVFLDNSIEAALTILAAAGAGLIAVPINSKLKPHQAHYILDHCTVRALVTSPFRFRKLAEAGATEHLIPILTSGLDAGATRDLTPELWWSLAHESADGVRLHRCVDTDPAAILYTSGSTGMPKGVTLSHRNLTSGAQSVNAYLGTRSDDAILSLLPLSFDAGLSQLTTGIAAGARVVMHGYIRPQEVVSLCEAEGITSITGVPPLWNQLASVPWTDGARDGVRLFANTGGHMYASLLGKLRELFSQAKPYLMYGLTEAFRSTYLDPAEVDRRPNSIGKAIPNAEILLLNEAGEACAADEPGELVHRGSLVALGYWNDPEKTAERFRALSAGPVSGLATEMAVWSGDIVKMDAQGFLYFVGRRDEMIKSSGYRISPTEVEAVVLQAPGVQDAAVFAVPDERLGQLVVAAVATSQHDTTDRDIRAHCDRQLPPYMVPLIFRVDTLPRLGNGKIDRKSLPDLYAATPASRAVQ